MYGKTQLTLAVIFAVLIIAWGGTRLYLEKVEFNVECGDVLKRAADANTIQLAKKELKAALDYMEREELTSGYTSIMYNSPSEDVGFWYTNVKTSYEELLSLPNDVAPLERSNMLMKLRETLLDNTDSGTTVTVPKGISVFPHNTLFACWGWGSFLLCGIFLWRWYKEN